MQISQDIFQYYAEPLEASMGHFLVQHKWIASENELQSVRFLQRSIAPHIMSFSGLFNRLKKENLNHSYWKHSESARNQKLAYFLNFMPTNAYRISSIWYELYRLGFRLPTSQEHYVLELGSGPACGLTGLGLAEQFAPLGLSTKSYQAMIDQSHSLVQMGKHWLEHIAPSFKKNLDVRAFSKTLEPFSTGKLLPDKAPAFHIWIMSYFLNEILDQTGSISEDAAIETLASILYEQWLKHLLPDGIVIISEPALKMQSRRILKLRQVLLKLPQHEFQILTPCLGHQSCGALAQAQDWCHEVVPFMRPAYMKKLDKFTTLDHKSLAMTYLVIARSRKPRSELLPKLQNLPTARLVSPTIYQGRDLEFFICHDSGKKRARMKKKLSETPIERGSILLEPSMRGHEHATRIDSIKNVL